MVIHKRKRKRAVKDPCVVLIEAARDYSRALKRQHKASAALHRARFRKDVELFDQKRGAACDALDAAEHALLVCAAVVGGWSRKSAEKSV